MTIHKHTLYNTLGQQIMLQPLESFLKKEPGYGDALAKTLIEPSLADRSLTPSCIQRACTVKYLVAEAILATLLDAKIACMAPETEHVSLCIDRAEAEALVQWIDSVQKSLLPEADA